MIQLHLFSSLGEHGIQQVVQACLPYVKNRVDPLVVYLPAGNLGNTYQEITENAFRQHARVATLDTERMALDTLKAMLREAAVLYIPGGNTYLMNHRLHLCGWMEALRRKVSGGLPVVAFSAGTVFCGANVLTSNDLNLLPTSHFKGLQATHCNFNVHYPLDPCGQAARDAWLSDYHVFQDNPVVLLADDALIHVQGRKVRLDTGEAWVLRKGEEKEKLQAGQEI